MKALLPSLLALLGSFGPLAAAIVEKPLEYKSGDVVCEGWQAYDDAVIGPRPGVLVVHQWTGISDHEKEAARKLAALGYNVLVADIYGKGKCEEVFAASVKRLGLKRESLILQSKCGIRADLGAIQNRFSSTIASLAAGSENISAARSRIQDADFAAETASLTRNQILQQAGIAMLAQANALPQSVLSLLK